MLKGLFKRETPEQKFWNWFQRNSDKYYEMSEENQEELFDLLQVHLQRVHKELVFEFSAEPNAQGVRELIISADGIRELIPFVVKLVNVAPRLEKWKITAFRQRAEGMEIGFHQYRISEDNTFFTYEYMSDQELLNVNLYVENYEPDMGGALFLLLDSTLGEFEVMTKLGYIHFDELKNADGEELLPLSKLYDLVKEIEKRPLQEEKSGKYD